MKCDMICEFCSDGSALPFFYGARNFTLCAPCASAIITSPHTALAQCCECGIFLSGPGIGKIYTKRDGTPNLAMGLSHGMCKLCRDKKMNEWLVVRQQRAARRLTKQG